MKRFWIIGLLLLCALTLLKAEKQYSFLQVNSADGLVNNQITKIYKDKRGFIWIGTTAGLSRYDGASFLNYKHDSTDSTSISDNYIVKIMEDKRGNLWLSTSQGILVYDVDKEKFINSVNRYLGINGEDLNIEDIYADQNDLIWIKTYNSDYYQQVNVSQGSVINVFKYEGPGEGYMMDIQHANNGYYCLYSSGTIVCYDDQNYKPKFRTTYLKNQLGPDSIDASIFVDQDNDIWLYGNNSGVYHYTSAKESWEQYSATHGKLRLTSNIVRRIVQDDKGNIWVGTDHGGINIINKYSGEVQSVTHQAGNLKSVAQNSITELYVDNNDIVWVGTYKNGVSYFHESIHKFPHYKKHLSDKHSLPYNDVNCFVEDKRGNLWIGTNGGGLIYFDRTRNRYTTYKHKANDPYSLSNDIVVGVFIDSQGELWAGTFTGGLNRFDGKRFYRYQKDENAKHPSGLTNNNIWTINEDDLGRLWVGTLGGGVVWYDRGNDVFVPLENNSTLDLLDNTVYQIYKLSDGNMLIATSGGVAFYNVKEKRFKHLPFSNLTSTYNITNKNVNALFEDSRGLVWVATREGLIVFDPRADYIKYFNSEDGIPEDIVNCIEEDEFQCIWISKSTGLSQIVVNKSAVEKEFTFHVYDFTEEDGLQGQEFNPNASLRTSKNELIFGGPNGFNLFEAKNLKYNQVLPKVMFTGFQVYNQSISPESEVSNFTLLEKSIVATKEIEIRHAMNVFSIEFTALDFFIPSKIRYKYKLEGFNDEWLPLNNQNPRVTYTNLNAGDYYFRVKAANNDGLWNENYAELKIKVLPPIYATPLAYVLYFVLLAISLVYFRYNMLNRERRKFAVEQERLHAKRNHELDEMKLRFLTNVSHEFRTPLTLILTPLDKLQKHMNAEEDRKLLDIIDRNAKQLLSLVNQLLDFRKLELHGLQYNPSYGNLVVFAHEVADKFEDAFNKKHIRFTFDSSVSQFMMNFDREKLEKVVMNLLSNALKFTPEGGSVEMNLEVEGDDEFILLNVTDSGIGINPEDVDKIFVRFFQSENNKKLGLSGSGIGLNLAREMVQLHNGTIEVNSTKGEGATFMVRLPVDRSALNEEAGSQPEEKPVNAVQIVKATVSPSKKQTVLLIEDNVDFRTFMKETLKDKFSILEAPDGEVGYELVHKEMPDLIISDVMMPKVDGLELCTKLRKDIRTSHIPLILLTARTADEDKIKGLEIGADDYITKPFNMDLLLLRIHKLLEKRNAMQKRFQKTVDIAPSQVDITSMDEKLIKKAIALVEKNMAESSFSVEELSRELGMSRVYLYKKLISITGKSPVEFIRIIRLKRGAQLLKKSQMNITEVAYEVGFNSPRYFSKYFKEEYGMLPTMYVKQHQNP